VKWLRFPRVVGVVVVIYFALVTAYFLYETTAHARFITDATAATGVVVALEPRPTAGSTRIQGSGGDIPLAPQVRYEVDGKTYVYTPSHGVVGSPVKVGDPIEILYDPANPAIAKLRGEGRILLPVITAGFATVTLLLVVFLILTRNRGLGNDHPYR
jgi:hypothetical protein